MVELVFGVAIGLMVAGLIVIFIGVGAVQIGVVVALAMLAVVFFSERMAARVVMQTVAVLAQRMWTPMRASWRSEGENGETHGDKPVVVQQLGDDAGRPSHQLPWEEAELETYVICARVKSPDVPGGSGLNWTVNPGGEELVGGLLREVLKAVEGNGMGSNGQGSPS